MAKLLVKSSKKYQIIIKSDMSGFEEMKKLIKGKNVLIVTDKNVDLLYGETLANELSGYNVVKHVLPSGEEYKNAENYLGIIKTLADNNFTRKDTLITFGGGVVGDMGAFSASTYMRGITLISIPTTILSMVDSSVGGKTAIDLENGKNLLGTFYQPDGVYINLGFIKSLPEREILSGYGEIIKYAFLKGKIEKSNLEGPITEDLIEKCLTIKKKIVTKDERESGTRKLLNLGHTIGHALEKMSNYTHSHGECVLMGIDYAIDFSKKIFNLSQEKVDKMKDLLYSKGKVTRLVYDAKEIANQIKSDKKSDNTGVDFVLLKDVKKPIIKHLDFNEIESLLTEI